MKNKHQLIDYINIGIMAITTVVAFVIPFHLFLFSYVVLGPLHYLTEIDWLRHKNFFTQGKRDVWILILLTLLIFPGGWIIGPLAGAGSYFFAVAFLAAITCTLVKNWHYRLTFVGLAIASLLFVYNHQFILLVGILLPTIVHVLIFTGCFMLFGALKSKHISGVLSVSFFILCSLSFFIYMPEIKIWEMNGRIFHMYAFFEDLHFALADIFNLATDMQDRFAIYHSQAGYAIMRFVAFAYTYHYLNWFSKTSIIKWHKTSRLALGIVISGWIASVVLYFIDYQIGFLALLFLSILHVVLEFPLNVKSVVGIGQEVKALVRKE